MTGKMRRFKYFFPAVLMIMAITHLPSRTGAFGALGQSKYVPVTTYDPKRDADKDIEDAIQEATRTNKRILLEVGGEWCSWCHTLDKFFETHPGLLSLRDKNFVTVKINFSEENENKDVLSRYGPIQAYPHIFVLERDGKLLHSQNTGDLESGKSYDLERLTAFLTKWSPAR
jgi:thioredoxin-related protein